MLANTAEMGPQEWRAIEVVAILVAALELNIV